MCVQTVRAKKKISHGFSLRVEIGVPWCINMPHSVHCHSFTVGCMHAESNSPISKFTDVYMLIREIRM